MSKNWLKFILGKSALGFIKLFLFKITKYGGINSYSQAGEDVWLFKLFHPKKADNLPYMFKKNGFYIDIGANHPVINSQTYMMYRRGWRGITIDPLPASANLFKKVRPKDIHIQIGIAPVPGNITYYMYDNSVLNSFNKEESTQIASKLGSKMISTAEVPVLPLSQVLNQHLPHNLPYIDFMSVDTEGFDFEVIKSNDWDRFRPKYLIVESHNLEMEKVQENSLYRFMKDRGYKLVGIIGENCIYEDLANPHYHHDL